jgi:putative tricarboxylic transport membrane protein
MPPLILGFILGGMLEKNLRRALLINDGSFSFMWERPISLALFIIMVLIILLQIYQGLKKQESA